VADNITIASFLASFYALSVSASLEYVEYAGMLLPLYITYSRMQTQITRKKNAKNDAIVIASATSRII
jgi:hypothetical protein